MDQASKHLAKAARAVAEKLTFPDHYPVILSGGAYKACPSLIGRLEVLLESPEMDVRHLEVEPAMGAVTLALELLQ